MRSKRRSAPSSGSEPQRSPAFFIDRSLGRYHVADALRGVGEQVEIHDDHLARDASDEAWMRLAAANGWVVLTRDARIRHRPLERACLLDAGLIVFVLTSASLTGPEMAAAFLAARGKIRRVLDREEGPLAPLLASRH